MARRRMEPAVRQPKLLDRVRTAIRPRHCSRRTAVLFLYRHVLGMASEYGRVMLPFAVARKYPSAATDWRWQFVFPRARICRDPRFGPPSRYHLHESVVQKSVAQAARAAGIAKRVGPYTLRHCFATHLLEALAERVTRVDEYAAAMGLLVVMRHRSDDGNGTAEGFGSS